MISSVDAKDPNTLLGAATGGRNDEPHNHNDVGNCIVHSNGESLIVDMGAPVYERDFFQSDKRYSYFTARSLGHSVPFVNGFEQRPGPFGAKNVQSTHTAERDSLISDIADAYPQEAGLQSLIRHVSLFRESGGRVEIGDHAIFRESPRSYESALLTFGNVETPQPGQLRIQGEKASLSIEYDASLWEIAVEEKSSKEVLLRVAEKYPVIRRIAFRCIKPAMEIDWKIVVLPGK